MPLSFSTIGSLYWRPISRLMAKKVLMGLVTAWRLAGWPTRRSLSSWMATTEGVVRTPSAFSMTLGVLPSMMATHEFVVPRSMPMILLMVVTLSLLWADAAWPLIKRHYAQASPGSLIWIERPSLESASLLKPHMGKLRVRARVQALVSKAPPASSPVGA